MKLSNENGSSRLDGRLEGGVLVAVVIGALAAVGLGVFGTVHDPQFFSLNVAGFSSRTAVKSWLATVAVALALFQLASALAMYRCCAAPGAVVDRHRACPVRPPGQLLLTRKGLRL